MAAESQARNSLRMQNDIIFGTDGNDRHNLGSGWSGDEPGYRWTEGARSELWLNNPGPHKDWVLVLHVAPWVHPPLLPVQRLAVLVRGAEVGRTELAGPRALALRIPAGLLAAPGPMRIVFEHPDAAAPVTLGVGPGDTRLLGISFRHLRLCAAEDVPETIRIEGGERIAAADIAGLMGIPPERFLMRFESLGDNCEFGLVQRRCGAEPLGLLRFSNIALANLLRGIEREFDSLGDPAAMQFHLQGNGRREYALTDQDFGLTFHTFLYEGEVNVEGLVAQQSIRLKFLRRKLLEDISAGEKIFVIKRNDPLAVSEILPLHAALNQYAANTLLFVVPATADHPSGTVEQLAPRLLRGYIDRFAPYDNAHDLLLEVWLALCVNAARIKDTPVSVHSRGLLGEEDSNSNSFEAAVAEVQAVASVPPTQSDYRDHWQSMRTRLILDDFFGSDTKSQSFLISGWSTLEPGFVWAIGPVSRLDVPVLDGANDQIIELYLDPFVIEEVWPCQRISLTVNGSLVGRSTLKDKATVAYVVPKELLSSGIMHIEIAHPDAARPSEKLASEDSRELSICLLRIRTHAVLRDNWIGTSLLVTDAVFRDSGAEDASEFIRRTTGLGVDQLMIQFESLGENCEFGLVQRSYGAEPLGLLRFSSVAPRDLIGGVDSGFAGLGIADKIDPQLDESGSGEYIVYERGYNLRYHTFVYQHQASPDQVRAREAKKLSFLRRKFMDDVASGEKIFVYQRARQMDTDEILPIVAALRSRGPATLLVIRVTPDESKVGTVETTLPGLLIGYIDRLAPPGRFEFASREAWLRICYNAFRLWTALQ